MLVSTFSFWKNNRTLLYKLYEKENDKEEIFAHSINGPNKPIETDTSKIITFADSSLFLSIHGIR